MKYSLATYSNLKYQKEQNNLLEYAAGTKLFDSFFTGTEYWLKNSEFYIENKKILDLERGAGYWLWKPYLILEAMKTIRDGDIVFYIDCGDMFLKTITSYTTPILEKECCLLLGGGFLQKDWTKRDCFYYMSCDSKDYLDVIQLEAGVQFWKKTSKSIQVLEEQIKFCKDHRILTDASNECGLPNYMGFKDHRHDQSVLTNLFVKYQLAVDSTKHQTPYNQMRNYVRCNITL